MILADVSFMDIFWSMLWLYFLFAWIVVLAHIFGDLFRDDSLSGVTKTLWVLFLVFLPFLGSLVYVIVRGRGMTERSAARRRVKAQSAGYGRETSANGAATPTEQITQAKELLDAGVIDRSEFDRLKATALAER
jgi:hypothetical protein